MSSKCQIVHSWMASSKLDNKFNNWSIALTKFLNKTDTFSHFVKTKANENDIILDENANWYKRSFWHFFLKCMGNICSFVILSTHTLPTNEHWQARWNDEQISKID